MNASCLLCGRPDYELRLIDTEMRSGIPIRLCSVCLARFAALGYVPRRPDEPVPDSVAITASPAT